MTKEELSKMSACRHLLPDPGPEVVEKLICALEAAQAELEGVKRIAQEQHRQLGSGLSVVEELASELERMKEQVRWSNDHLETAWGVIANAQGGDWDRDGIPGWKQAAERWRDEYFDHMKATSPLPEPPKGEQT